MGGEAASASAASKVFPEKPAKATSQPPLSPDRGAKEQIDPRTRIAIDRLAKTANRARSTVRSTV